MASMNLQNGSRTHKKGSSEQLRKNGKWMIPSLSNVPIGYRLAFYGPMCSGKTECANYLVRNYGYTRLSLADKLKAIAYELYGIQGKDGDNRRIIQELGDSLRSFDDDVFTKYTLATIGKNYPYSKIVIDDLRLPQEANLLKRNGFYLVQVQCPDDTRLARVRSLYPSVPQDRQSHPTETAWSKIPPHTAIISETPADLILLDKLVTGIE
jgi:AAA domain